MSVLRKHSPWVIPAASLLLGALTLGLAGCGGSDSTGSPTPVPATINIPGTIQLTVPTAGQPTPVVRGQGATVQAPTQQNPNSTGATGASITIPVGAIQDNATLGVEVLPLTDATLEKVRQANAGSVAGLSTLTEIVFGPIDANGKIDPSRPIVFGGDVTLDLNAAIPGSCTPVVFVEQGGVLHQVPVNFVNTIPEASTADTTCRAYITPDLKHIVIRGNCATGRVIVGCASNHQQGGIG